jgi:hypothetical protein
MSGKDLYELFVACSIDLGCGMDEWIELDELAQSIWELLARVLNNMKGQS